MRDGTTGMWISGEPPNLGLNAKFLIEMFSAIAQEEVEFELSDSNKPAILVPTNKIPGKYPDLLSPIINEHYFGFWIIQSM